jgi:hypothetical protein
MINWEGRWYSISRNKIFPISVFAVFKEYPRVIFLSLFLSFHRHSPRTYITNTFILKNICSLFTDCAKTGTWSNEDHISGSVVNIDGHGPKTNRWKIDTFLKRKISCCQAMIVQQGSRQKGNHPCLCVVGILCGFILCICNGRSMLMKWNTSQHNPHSPHSSFFRVTR